MGLIGGGAPDPFLFPEKLAVARAGYSNTDGRMLRSSTIAGTVKTVIVGGQSNMATTCGTARYTTVSGQAYNLNPYNGGLYTGVDPIFGATENNPAANQSSIAMRVADRIIVNHPTWSVVMCGIAIGGTAYADWVPAPDGNTSLFYRLQTAILRCRARGFEPDYIIWGEGETDGPNGTSAASVTASIQAIATGLRAPPLSCNAPLYVGLYTLISGANSTTVRTGIINSISVPLGIVLGFDADTNCPSPAYRLADATHFNDLGLTTCANAWADLILP